MRSIGAILLFVCGMVSACGAVGASPEPTGTSSGEPGRTSPLPSLGASSGCLDSRPDAGILGGLADPADCLGSQPLTFDAPLAAAGAVDCGPTVEPVWLSCPNVGSLLGVGEIGSVPFILFAIDPTSGVFASPFIGTMVHVTGHFDDPAAQSCHQVETIAGEAPRPASDVIENCRNTFVLTQLIAPVPTALAPNGFAQVVAARVNVREAPGLDAPTLSLPPVGDSPVGMRPVLGTDGGSQHVYILEGPVSANGFDWFRVAPIDWEGNQHIYPEFVGWTAAGDAVDPWLVPENPCPTGPITLADLTYSATTTNWATRLGCFRGQELTLRGWYLVPEGIGFEEPCPNEPAFLMCGSGVHDIRTAEMSYYDQRSADRLVFVVNPQSGIVMPPPKQWIEIIGHWDDPAAALCPVETIPWDSGTLACRIQFVISSVTALGANP